MCALPIWPTQLALKDRFSAPPGNISAEIVTTGISSNASGIIDLAPIWSNQPYEYISRHSSVVPNFAASSSGNTRNLDYKGKLLAHGVPFLSADPAAGWSRYKLTCEGRELINVNSVQGVLGGETDDTIYNESGSITDPGATSVIWKSTRDHELAGGDGNTFLEVDTGTTTMASTEIPLWTYQNANEYLAMRKRGVAQAES